jgi:hypothetical protein
MSACRVARRVASMTGYRNPCSEAVQALALATKVFHYPFQSFSSRRGGRAGGRRAADRVRLLTGGGQFAESGGARRVALSLRGGAPPFVCGCLVTERECGGIQ